MMKRLFIAMMALVLALGVQARNPKVLILSSSPRKGGNTELLCQEFMRGATEAGATVELLNLNDYRIDFFNEQDAEYGMKRQHNPEVRDDAPMIVKKMGEADIIVLSSPVYFMNITGQLKTLFDRTFACEANRDLIGKQYYFITACTDEDESTAQCAIDGFRGFTMCIPRSKVMGEVKAVGMREIGAVKASQFMNQAYEMGKTVSLPEE